MRLLLVFTACFFFLVPNGFGQADSIEAVQNNRKKEVKRKRKIIKKRKVADKKKKEEFQNNIKGLFTLDNLYKLLFSEDQDELVKEYLQNFKGTSEEDIIKNFNNTIKVSPLNGIIEENGVFIRLYARIHKEDNLLLSLAAMFKDRSQFYLFLAVSGGLFFMGFLRKKYNKKIKGTPGAMFKNLFLASVILFLHFVSVLFFFGDNIRPIVMAYKEISREVEFGDKL